MTWQIAIIKKHEMDRRFFIFTSLNIFFHKNDIIINCHFTCVALFRAVVRTNKFLSITPNHHTSFKMRIYVPINQSPFDRP